jgi:hypothetical protein
MVFRTIFGLSGGVCIASFSILSGVSSDWLSGI